MKKYFLVLLVFLIYNAVMFSSPKDTGFIKWEQPNGTEFIARHWGDEFLSWMQTENGYMLVDSPEGWYYYAILDKNGEYTASDAKVGIDNEIEAEKEWYSQQLLDRRNTLINTMSRTNTTVKLGVVLIDFPTNRHDTLANNGDGYYNYNFENMIFSTGAWYHTEDRNGNVTYSPHPEFEKVYGSLKEYYYEMSVGSYEIVGKNSQAKIVNPADPNNPDLPEWLILSHEMSYYESLSSAYFMETIFDEVVDAYGETEMNSYDIICFIYGGAVRTSGNFNPKSRFNKYCMGEYEWGSFAHIGTHAHEFAHAALAASDEYEGDPSIDPGRYELMSDGTYNGPLGHCSCPASLSPYYRIKYGWVTPTVITPEVASYSINYGSPTPNFYKINIPCSDEYFILETRRGTGFDQYTPNYIGSNAVGGILIWHIDPNAIWDYVELEFADDVYGNTPWSYDRFPQPINSIQNFNDNTLPSSRLRDGTISGIAINNIDWSGLNPTSYGIVDVLDLPPETPTGFTLSGSVGQNPTLSWNSNNEIDLDEYKLYQSFNGNPYSLLITLGPTVTSFTDPGVVITDGKFDPSVCYKLTSVDFAENESNPCFPKCTKSNIISKQVLMLVDEKLPEDYELFDAYPNPFNPTTQIKFALPEKSTVKLTIYNMLGEKIATLVNRQLKEGFYEYEFDASDLTSGTYIYRLGTNQFSLAKKLMLVK